MTMKKNWYQSKTVWGALVFAVSSFLIKADVVGPSFVTDLLQYASAFWTAYGFRDAIQ